MRILHGMPEEHTATGYTPKKLCGYLVDPVAVVLITTVTDLNCVRIGVKSGLNSKKILIIISESLTFPSIFEGPNDSPALGYPRVYYCELDKSSPRPHNLFF
jgi:hypothetical protein